MSINVVIISGTVERIFEPRILDSGTEVNSGVIKVESGEDRFANHIFTAFSAFSRKEFEKASVGDYVIINGRLNKSNFKKDGAWVEKYEVVVNQVDVLTSSGHELSAQYAAVASSDDHSDIPF